MALAFAGSPQEENVRKLLETLRSDDVSERDNALAELKKTPLDQLKLLEPGLESKDPEFRSRIHEAMNEALSGALGKRLVRFCARAVATQEVTEQWAKTGYDPAKVPEGYERTPKRKDIQNLENFPSDQVLVEKEAVVTNENIRSSEPTEVLEIGGSCWVATFELDEEGARRFDDAARRLYNQKPSPGLLALFVDGEMVMAPVIRSPSFGGHGQIAGAKTREECQRTVSLLKGTWIALSFRVTRERGEAVPVEELNQLLRNLSGFEQVECSQSRENGFSIKGPINTRGQDIVKLWITLRQKGYTLLPRRTDR
jgi:preprotein translocase subunit SecD